LVFSIDFSSSARPRRIERTGEDFVWLVSNVGGSDELRYVARVAREDTRAKGRDMELAIFTVMLLVAASQIPGDYHVVFFR
jgi:hypothetical protein